jgi:hypothetical protein
MNNAYWLVHYKQRRYGTQEWIEANTVAAIHPVVFLMQMKKRDSGHESVVTFATEVPEDLAHLYIEAY